MFIDVDPAAGTTTLVEAEDFKNFSVRVPSAADSTSVAKTLSECKAGRMVGDGAEIDVRWLRASGPQDEVWVDGFDKMVAYAATKGWVDAERTLIKAHLEPR